MSISKIRIENIRGFANTTLDLTLRPNYVNILVAPNGFGKSSISTAFNCLTTNKLVVRDANKHKGQDHLRSLLGIFTNNVWLMANEEKNDIAEHFQVRVIKSNLEPKAKLPKYQGFTVARPYIEIPAIDLGPAVKRTVLTYSSSAMKTSFGINSKLVPNLETRCADRTLRAALLDKLEAIGKISQKRSLEVINEITLFAKQTTGTKREIGDGAENLYSGRLNDLPALQEICGVLRSFDERCTWLDAILLCKQLSEAYHSSRPTLKGWLQYGAYLARIDWMNRFLRSINGAWVAATVKEVKGRILVQFPDAASLSNGQRDLLYFGCRLLQTREGVSKKPTILFIDEVFDYLDDANIAVAQYFLSQLIEDFRSERSEIYVCLLTHLDPNYFKGYALQRQATVYLGGVSEKITETMKKVIVERDNPIWKDDLSTYFLHYHPSDRDLKEIFNSNFRLPKRHGSSFGFYSFMKDEWEKFRSGSGEYDPFAVCAHLRVAIERIAYGKLQSEADKASFLCDQHGTRRKLAFAEERGISVPEVCFLLGVIYNDAMHRKGALEQASFIGLKLRNLALRDMMIEAVRW